MLSCYILWSLWGVFLFGFFVLNKQKVWFPAPDLVEVLRPQKHLWSSRYCSSPCPGDWGALPAGSGGWDDNVWTPSLAIWVSTLLTTQETGWVRGHSSSSLVWMKVAAAWGAREGVGGWGRAPRCHLCLGWCSPPAPSSPTGQPVVVRDVLWGVTGSWEGGHTHATAAPMLRWW